MVHLVQQTRCARNSLRGCRWRSQFRLATQTSASVLIAPVGLIHRNDPSHRPAHNASRAQVRQPRVKTGKAAQPQEGRKF